MSTSLAYGQLFTYSQWERLPEEERQVYLAGALDTMVGVTEDGRPRPHREETRQDVSTRKTT